MASNSVTHSEVIAAGNSKTVTNDYNRKRQSYRDTCNFRFTVNTWKYRPPSPIKFPWTFQIVSMNLLQNLAYCQNPLWNRVWIRLVHTDSFILVLQWRLLAQTFCWHVSVSQLLTPTRHWLTTVDCSSVRRLLCDVTVAVTAAAVAAGVASDP